MQNFLTRRTIIVAIIVIVFAVGAYVVFHRVPKVVPIPVAQVIPKQVGPVHTVIGYSVQGRPIDAYTYGTGSSRIAFVGGIHGGYEWNAVVLAYDAKDYFDANPDAIPANESVTVIPDANPDGTFKIIGKEGPFTVADVPKNVPTAPGRFNANDVDLNRNFDCKWAPKSTWQDKVVSGGSAPFSEPEARAIRDFVSSTTPVATVFWHSQSGNVYASQCKKGILPGTTNLLNTYATASGYHALKTFDAYATSGGADDWMSTIGLSAVTVELTTHTDVEWEKNLAGIKAVLQYYGK